MVAVMGYEVSRDILRASQLVHELQASEAGLRESEARMSLAVDAADFGIWIRDFARKDVWASAKFRELFGFTPSEPLEYDAILNGCIPTIVTLRRRGGDGRCRCERRQVSGGIPAVDAGWHDPVDCFAGPCRTRRARVSRS